MGKHNIYDICVRKSFITDINTAKNYLVSMGRRPKVIAEIEIEDVENFDGGDEMRTEQHRYRN